eukprot:2503925-Prymnesium_polylepis.1
MMRSWQHCTCRPWHGPLPSPCAALSDRADRRPPEASGARREKIWFVVIHTGLMDELDGHLTAHLDGERERTATAAKI